jgi:hypothetical protein
MDDWTCYCRNPKCVLYGQMAVVRNNFVLTCMKCVAGGFHRLTAARWAAQHATHCDL